MSWLDHVLAVPAIGIQTEPNLESFCSTQSPVARLLQELLGEEGEVSFQGANPWAMNVHTPHGYHYTIHHNNLVVQFQYSANKEEREGELPQFGRPAREAFSNLLRTVRQRMNRLLAAVVPEEGLKVMRMGIMATCNLKKDSLPPGVDRLVKHLSKPWDGSLIKSEALFLAKINETESSLDRCHHAIHFDETQPAKGFQFTLDWQRVMKSITSACEKEILKNLDDCQKEALKYFERVAEGGLNLE